MKMDNSKSVYKISILAKKWAHKPVVGTIQVHKLVLTGHTECQFQLNTPLGELEICDKTALTKSYMTKIRVQLYNMFSNNFE